MRKCQSILIALVLVLAAFAGTVSAQRAQPQQQEQQKTYNKDGSEVHLCGAPTKAGGRCKRHVKKAGDRCFMHKGK